MTWGEIALGIGIVALFALGFVALFQHEDEGAAERLRYERLLECVERTDDKQWCEEIVP